MSADGDVSYRRYRRRILGWGAAALAVVFAIGATVAMTQVEDDLEGRVVTELDEAGIAGVRVSFSGQEGTLTCTTTLAGDEEVAALDRLAGDAAALQGVRSIHVDGSCRTVDEPDGASGSSAGEPAAATAGTSAASNTTDDPATTTTEPPPGQSTLEVIATDPQFSTLHRAIGSTGLVVSSDGGPTTFFAPSNDAFEALDPDEAGWLNADPELLSAILARHLVAGEVLIDGLDEGPLDTRGGPGVRVERGPDDVVTLMSAGATATVVDADLVATDGVVHVVDGLLVPGRARLEPVDPEVEASTRAAALQLDLDGITDATQIGFGEGSTDVSFLSGPTFDRVAEAILARPGSTVVVRGHTDAGGTDIANLFVSTARAEAVVEQLVLRGVSRGRLASVGMGSGEPVIVEGVEDRVASRRVDFLVETVPTG